MIRCKINGIEYKLNARWTIQEQTANKISSTVTVLVDNDQVIPECGDLIEIYSDTTGFVYFLGVCGIPRSPVIDSKHTPREYTITCANANDILDRRVVNVAYQNYTVSEIIHEYFEKYISQEGITLGHISDINIPINIYVAPTLRLKHVLDELAEYVEGSWFVSNDRKFYFYDHIHFPEMPITVDENFLPISGLQITFKDTDRRTNQIITGATNETLPQVENFTFTTEANFIVSFGISRQPTFTVKGVAVPPEAVGVKGLNMDDNSRMFLWAYNSPIISYNRDYTGTTPPPMEEGDTFTIEYVGMYPILVNAVDGVQANDLAGKTGTSGLIDNVEINRTLKDIDDANVVANNLLKNYGKNRGEITGFVDIGHAMTAHGLTLDDFALLRKWHINLPRWGAVGDFVMVEKRITPNVLKDGVENLHIEFKLVDSAFMRPYGNILDGVVKSIEQLAIREDEVVINNESIAETLVLSEEYTFNDIFDGTQIEETLALSEETDIGEVTDFMLLKPTTAARFSVDKMLVQPCCVNPSGLGYRPFSQNRGHR